MMETTKKDVFEIIEDHTRICDYLDNLCCAVENPKVEIPNFIPVCNDGLITERLTTLTEFIRKQKMAQ